MSISGWTIYWLTRLGGIQTFLLTAGIATFIGGITAFIGTNVENANKWIRVSKKVAVIGFVMIILGILTPTTKEAAAIIIIPKLANSETLKRECGEIYNLAKDWLTNLSEDKKGK